MKEAKEKLVMAKELTDLFQKQGVQIHYHYARELIAACPETVRRRYIRFSDAWDWWVLNPDFQPFSEKGPKSDSTRTLSTLLDTARK